MVSASSLSARLLGSAVYSGSSMDCCTEQSLQLGEPVEASAVVDTPRWLMIQVQDAWAPKTPNTAALQGEVGAHIDAELARVGGARLQLIRRPQACAAVTVIAATAGGGNPTAYRLQLGNLSELVDVDLAALFEGGAGGEALEDPLILICTHGLRDRCCAVEGVPVYNALYELAGEQVWQTTHLGGHRFAATLVVLPAGLQFGRVKPEEVPSLIEGLEQGEIYRLDRFRGRVDASRIAQVAEAHVRAKRGLRSIDAVEPAGDDLEVEGRRLRVQVSSTPHPEPRAFSCGDTQLRTPMVHSTTVLG